MDDQIEIPLGLVPQIQSITKKERTQCPTCGMKVRVRRRVGGASDRIRPILIGHQIGDDLEGMDEKEAKRLTELRKGKRTVAMVGMAITSCGKAPYDRPSEEVEIWGLNEAHAFPWMKRADRWFQIHASKSWKRYIAKRDVLGHFDWLKKNPWDIPIVMQYFQKIVPKSESYPLKEVSDKAFKNFDRGGNRSGR